MAIIVKGSTPVDAFNLIVAQTPNNITGTQTTVAEQDVNIVTTTTSGSDNNFAVQLSDNLTANSTLTLTNLTPGIISLDQKTGKATRLANGTAIIRAAKVGYGAINYQQNMVNGVLSVKSYVASVAGTLAKHISTNMQALIASYSPSLPTFPTWNGYDLTGWRSNGKNCALISPQHIIFALHALAPSIGDWVEFTGADGSIHRRTIRFITTLGDDTGIALLNNVNGAVGSVGPLPSTGANAITPFALLPANWAAFLPHMQATPLSIGMQIPCLMISGHNLAQNALVDTFIASAVSQLDGFTSLDPNIAKSMVNYGSKLDLQNALFANWKNATDKAIAGDSNHPVFLTINNQLVLIGMQSSAISTPHFANTITAIQNAMDALSTVAGYSLQALKFVSMNDVTNGNAPFNNYSGATPASVSSVSSPTVLEGTTLVFAVNLNIASIGQLFAFSTTGTAVSGVDYGVPLLFNNGVTISGSNLNVPAGVTAFNASTITANNGIVNPNTTLILTIGGVTGTGTITDAGAPAGAIGSLTEIVIFEAPYAKLTGAQKTAIASGGGYPAFAVSRNSLSSPSYSVYQSATIGGIYTRVLQNQPYAQSAVVLGATTFDHRTLSVDNTSEFPASISPNTYAILADSTGQYEQMLVHNLTTQTLNGDNARYMTGIDEGIYDSLPISVSEINQARVYVVPTLPIYGTLIADATDNFYKVVPEDSSLNPISITAITPIKLTCQSIARKPYPVRFVEIGTATGIYDDFLAFRTSRINSTPQLQSRAKFSSRLNEVTPSSFFNPYSALEASTAMKLDILDADGATLIRTYTADVNGNFTYLAADRAADIARTNSTFSFYVQNTVSLIKSKAWNWNVECDVQNENMVTSVTTTKFSATIVKAVIAFTAAGASPAGIGQETGLAFVKISGTALANVNVAGITVNTGGAEIIEPNLDTSSLYIQFPRSAASVELSIPYAGSSTLTITVSAGTHDLVLNQDVFIPAAISTVTI